MIFIKLLFSLFIILALLGSKDFNRINIYPAYRKDTLKTNTQEKLIQGVWALNEEENAIYSIGEDSVFFVDALKSVLYKLRNDTFYLFFRNYTSKEKIILLTKDSLWIKSNLGEDILKLYRR